MQEKYQDVDSQRTLEENQRKGGLSSASRSSNSTAVSDLSSRLLLEETDRAISVSSKSLVACISSSRPKPL